MLPAGSIERLLGPWYVALREAGETSTLLVTGRCGMLYCYLLPNIRCVDVLVGLVFLAIGGLGTVALQSL